MPHKQGEGAASIFQSPSSTTAPPSGWMYVVPPTAIPEIQQISMLIICQRAIPAAAAAVSTPLSPHDGVFTFRILNLTPLITLSEHRNCLPLCGQGN